MRPPAFAIGVLERLGSKANRHAIAGDLIEQYERLPSPARLWRQVIVAILIGAVHDLWGHKAVALRALFLGSIIMFLFQLGGFRLQASVGKAVWNWTVDQNHDTIRLWWFTYNVPGAIELAISGMTTGCLVSLTHRDHPASSIFTFTVLMLMVYGWDYHVTVIHHIFTPPGLLAHALAAFVVMPICILVGGFLATGKTDSETRGIA